MQRTELIPPQFREGAERMAEAFRHVDQVIVAAHVNPDGDAVGAVAAAGHILRSMGKEFMLYAQPGLPGYGFGPPGAGLHECCGAASGGLGGVGRTLGGICTILVDKDSGKE